MNIHIQQRIQGIYKLLSNAFEAGALLSSASKGYEREAFISLFLSEVLPPIYRFGTGDITDAAHNNDINQRSGQIDIVIEMPWAPSFPIHAGVGARLYPAEAVGIAIEVKSNIETQWAEVVQGANRLATLRQQLSGISVDGDALQVHNITDEPIPFYAVGYDGWKTKETISRHLQNVELDGILVIKYQIFAWSNRKEHISKIARCNTELIKQHSGKSFDSTLASCARVYELQKESLNMDEIATKMNSENYSTKSIHFGDQNFTPKIDSGKWDSQNLNAISEIMSMKIKVLEGDSALLQFISFIHREVGKRAAMTTALSRYVE
jgi:hypothetical protein